MVFRDKTVMFCGHNRPKAQAFGKRFRVLLGRFLRRFRRILSRRQNRQKRHLTGDEAHIAHFPKRKPLKLRFRIIFLGESP